MERTSIQGPAPPYHLRCLEFHLLSYDLLCHNLHYFRLDYSMVMESGY